MRLFITGATGLIGRRLVRDRLERGDRVVLLTRKPQRATASFRADSDNRIEVVGGDPAIPGAWQRSVDGCDVVIHLAGAGVADRRWNDSYKREIVNSRLDGTFQIVEAIREAKSRPNVLVNASAVGWYGDTGDAVRDESAGAGPSDFFVDLVGRWEAEARKAEKLGVRVVMMRTGIVLDRRGGLLAKLIRPFKFFVGGPIGLGRQYMPWIHWRDLIGIIDLVMNNPEARGPINGTTPNPVTNRAFSTALGRAMGRPSLLPVPPIALRIVLGEFAHYALMSQRIVPTRARELGYRFVYPEIRSALESVLAEEESQDSPREREAPTPTPASWSEMERAMPAGHAAPVIEPPPDPKPAEQIRLLAIAVEGALLRHDGKLAQIVQRACQAAREAGCEVVLASGRPPRSVKPIAEAIGLDGMIICSQGAVIRHLADDQIVHHEALNDELAREIALTARAAAPDVMLGVETLDDWYTDRVDPAMRAMYGDALEPNGIVPFDGLFRLPVTQLNLFGSPATIAAVRGAIEAPFWRNQQITLFQPETKLVQVMHRLVDKGIALQRVASRLSIPRASVLAVGCRVEDLGMMEWAGFSVAMENAGDRVKSLADAIVPRHDEHGVARVIHRFVLIEDG